MPPNKDKIPGSSKKREQNIFAGGLQVSRRPDWPGYPETYILLKKPLLPPWNLIGPTPDIVLTSIPLMSRGVGDVSPFINTLPMIGYLTLNTIHLNNTPSIILTLSTSYDHFHRTKDSNYQVIPCFNCGNDNLPLCWDNLDKSCYPHFFV